MNIRIPPKLSPGDLIAITAPSSGVPEHLHTRLELAIQHLRNRGYQVIEGECLRQQYLRCRYRAYSTANDAGQRRPGHRGI